MNQTTEVIKSYSFQNETFFYNICENVMFKYKI